MSEEPDAELLAKYEQRAPGWVVRCLRCGFTEPWGKYGVRLWGGGVEEDFGAVSALRADLLSYD